MPRPTSPPPAAPAAYRIRVQGCIAARWSDWFGGLSLTEELDDSGLPVTVVSGMVPDQPALRGIINKLWDLNLTLISAERLTLLAESESNHERHSDSRTPGAPIRQRETRREG